jgi:dUTPase
MAVTIKEIPLGGIIKEKIKFLKVRKVKSPSRAYEFDAGIDFYVPEFTKQFVKDLKDKNQLIFGPDRTNHCGGTYDANGNLHVQGDVIAFSSGTSTISLQGNGSKVDYELEDKNDTLIKFDEEEGENYFILPPHSRMMLPSGIKSRMAQPGRALIAANKSGIATKHGLDFTAQVVDYTYKGEIHLGLKNDSTKNVRIYENMKILQFLETPVFISEVTVEESFYEYVGPGKPGKPVSPGEVKFYKDLKDDRGDGGFGSTNKI